MIWGIAGKFKKKLPGWSISRVLYLEWVSRRTSPKAMSISLAGALPPRSSSLPGITGDELSPPADRLYPCLALLRKGVAWPPVLLLAPVVSYTTFSPSPTSRLPGSGGIFLWPYPAPYGAPGITRQPALWSADFPRPTDYGRAHPSSLAT